MDRLDKRHKLGVAYDLIKRVMEDTDEEKWSYKALEDALGALDEWFEESEDER